MSVARPTAANALDHVVVLMFENRSFDNLLGRLYQPGEVESFEGVLGKDLSNPIPGWAEDAGKGFVPYGLASAMDTPNPDPGEELPHVNTQLFNVLDDGNRGLVTPEKTFNVPSAGAQPTMDGFVADYISMLEAELGRAPKFTEYSQIMVGYSPEQMPVLSGLARGFATFDHWFCEVPSCTFTNRSFFHAGTASGYVVNTTPADSFPVHNTAETLFDRLDAAGLTWRIYCDPPSHYSLTGVIHAARLHPRFATNFFSTEQFYADAERGELPTYSFIEPQIIGFNHNDIHAVQRSALGGGEGGRHHRTRSAELRQPVLVDRRRGPAGPHLPGRSGFIQHDGFQLLEHHPPRDLRRARRHLRPRPPARSRTARRIRARPVRLQLRPFRCTYTDRRDLGLDPRADDRDR